MPPHDKSNKVTVRPAKTQISLGICPVWSESSLCAQWLAKDPIFLHADSEDSDQTGRMSRLIWVFAGCTVTLLVLSWGGSYILYYISWDYLVWATINFFLFSFFCLGFTAKIISLILSRESIVKRADNGFPRKLNQLTTRKQNLAYLICDPSWARTNIGEMTSNVM